MKKSELLLDNQRLMDVYKIRIDDYKLRIDNLHYKYQERLSMQKAEFELLRAGEPWCGLWTLLGAKSCLGSVLAEICSNNMKSILWKKTYAQNAKDILQMIKNFGLDFEPVIVSVIHRVKGMECDTAILVRNVTSAVVSSELNDEDDERRVWYTAFTRARTRVILTELFKESRVVTNVI